MDAKTNLKNRLPSRHVTEGSRRAPRQLQPHVEITEVFKKTPEIADLNPGGRYVVTDSVEIGTIPYQMKALSDRVVRPLSKSMIENSCVVGLAINGAVTRLGGKAEKVSYADQ
jgi:dihydroxyacid dehydratase/phosphogluconate dehydratase